MVPCEQPLLGAENHSHLPTLLKAPPPPNILKIFVYLPASKYCQNILKPTSHQMFLNIPPPNIFKIFLNLPSPKFSQNILKSTIPQIFLNLQAPKYS